MRSQESFKFFSEITISKVATHFLALVPNSLPNKLSSSPPSTIKGTLNNLKKRTQTFMVNGVQNIWTYMTRWQNEQSDKSDGV